MKSPDFGKGDYGSSHKKAAKVDEGLKTLSYSTKNLNYGEEEHGGKALRQNSTNVRNS
jgi:hypothetical protein